MDMNEALLSAYADGELDAAATDEVEAWLAENEDARDTVAMHFKTAGLLRAALAEGNYARATDQLPVGRPRFAVPRLAVPRTVWAMAAAILLAIVGYGAGTWPGLFTSERDSMLTEIAEYHSVYSRETVHLVEVPAEQADQLRLWLGKRVHRDLVIPDFKQVGLTFAGGRMVVLDGMPAAELMYTRSNGLPIAFCILDRGGKQNAIQVERRGDLHLANWDDSSHSYVVVGEANADAIRGIADLARKQF
jgi:anti-sigma factor RsiW